MDSWHMTHWDLIINPSRHLISSDAQCGFVLLWKLRFWLQLLPSEGNLSTNQSIMGKFGYLSMNTDSAASELIASDFKELGHAAQKLANHAITLGGLGLGTSILKWIAFAAAVYLLILDRTNWRTNILTALLIPYIFLSLPSILFNIISGQIGKWIAFIGVILRLFFPQRVPEWAVLPASLVLLIVVAPSLFADTIRNDWIGIVICLIIGCYLLQEHIRASGGFRNSFTQSHGISNTVGIIILLVYPVWALIILFL